MTRTTSLILAMLATLLVAGISAYLLLLPQGAPVEAREEIDTPVRLLIPRLSIDAEIEAVGKNAQGVMGSPRSFQTVAWFKEGAVPGSKGSAVIAGHLDNALGLSGVFKNLKTLQPRDTFSAVDASGQEHLFEVTRVEEYPYQNIPLEEIFTRDDGTYLNLITCAGEWLSEERTYDKRVVVYARLVE